VRPRVYRPARPNDESIRYVAEWLGEGAKSHIDLSRIILPDAPNDPEAAENRKGSDFKRMRFTCLPWRRELKKNTAEQNIRELVAAPILKKGES
jgi:hypothetical protein